MGSATSVDNSPLSIDSFLSHAQNTQNTLNSEKQPSLGFKANLKIWSFEEDQPDGENMQQLLVEPFQFQEQEQIVFARNKCYLLLLLQKSTSGNEDALSARMPPMLLSARKKDSLTKYSVLATEIFSPRGLEFAFGTNQLLPYVQTASFSLYLWNGKDSSASLQAATLAQALLVEQALVFDPQATDRVFDIGGPVHLSQYISDDMSLQSKRNLQSKMHLLSHFVDDHDSQYPLASLFKSLTSVNNKALFSQRSSDRNSSSSREEKSSLSLSSPTTPPSSEDRTTPSPSKSKVIPSLRLGRTVSEDSSASSSATAAYSQAPIGHRLSPRALQQTNQHMTIPIPVFPSKLSPHGGKVPKIALGLARVVSARKGQQDSGGTQSSSRDSNLTSSSRIGDLSSSRNSDDGFTMLAPRHQKQGILAMDPNVSAAQKMAYYRKILSRMGRSYVYLGGDWIARNKEELKKNKVTHIINLAYSVCGTYFPNDFKYLCMSLYDSGEESVLGIFFTVVDFIETALNNKGRVYIHCFEGVSRSVTMVISYFMYCLFKIKQVVSANAVLEKVKTQREVASPNAGFLVQLMIWEKMLNNPSTYLFRIAPLNDRYYEHGEVQAKLCNSRELDSRTCFILWSVKGKAIYMWTGIRCTQDALISMGNTFSGFLKKYYADRVSGVDLPILKIQEQGDDECTLEHMPIFKQLLELVEVNEKGHDANKEYKDLSYFGKQPVKCATTNNPLVTVQAVDAGEEEICFEPADMWQYHQEDNEFDYLEKFDSGDLWDDGVYVIKPAYEEKHIIYLWIGNKYKFEDDEQSTFKKHTEQLIQDFMSRENLIPSEWKVTILKQGQEPEEFWTYFEDG